MPGGVIRRPDGQHRPEGFSELPVIPLEQKLVSVGSVAVVAVFMAVSVFLDWYSFATPQGTSAPALSGFASGPGIGAIVIAAFVLLNTAVWWVAQQRKTMRFISGWLVVDAAAATLIVAIGFINLGAGHWVIVATNAPLNASAGAGLVLFTVCTAAIAVRSLQLFFWVRTHASAAASALSAATAEHVDWIPPPGPYWYWAADGRGWVRKPYVDRYGHVWDGTSWHRDTRPESERWLGPSPPEPPRIAPTLAGPARDA